MELDGLTLNPTPLSELPSLSLLATYACTADSLQVQMLRGNYLSSLTICSEQVDFDDPGSWDWNMDDLILKVAKWKDEHWVDRSTFGHIRLHADSLQVQMLRGNYLSSLTIHSKQVNFDDPGSWDWNMDDLILKVVK